MGVIHGDSPRRKPRAPKYEQDGYAFALLKYEKASRNINGIITGRDTVIQ
jgi:hypothetical protein